MQFQYNDLPLELRLNILELLFQGSDPDPDRPGSNVVNTTRRYNVFLTDSNNTDFQHTWSVRLPADFKNLFVSKAYLQEALPLYAKTCCPELLGISVKPFLKPPNPTAHHSVLNYRLSFLQRRLFNVFNDTLVTLLRQTPTIRIEKDNYPAILKHTHILQDCLPNLRRIDLYSRIIRTWSVFNVGGKSKDIFEDPDMAESYHPHLRRVLAPSETRALQHQCVFPGDFGPLNRHATIRQDWPREVHNVRTVSCHAYTGQQEPNGQTPEKRNILIDLRIDVRAAKIVQANIRNGDLIRGEKESRWSRELCV